MEIRVQSHGPHVAIVTIDNQPRRNAMTRAMLADLARLWDELERGPCRCIVLTGAGERAFTAGADISGDLSASSETARVVSQALLKYQAYAKPIVAAVNGDCAGGGLELLLCSDIRAAAPHARFGLPEVRWSIYPFGGATIKLVQQIGHVHAMELLLTGKLIDAAEAARIGLVNRVVPAAELEKVTWALAEKIAAGPPGVLRLAKNMVNRAAVSDLASALDLEAYSQGIALAGDDHQEGLAAFFEKRTPKFTGR